MGAESDMKDTCFICSRNSYDFEHHGKGFDYHVRNEHNMWSYVFFFIHLNDMKTSDYTAIELFVSKLLEQENYDFFPMNRALCLASIDIDSTESKIDDLLHQVTSIAQKQREDEAEKKRKVEKLKQKRWQEKHRRFIFGIHHSADENELGDREPLMPPSNSSNDFYTSQQPAGNMLSVSDDSDFYKERKGSLTLIQILEGLPDDKSSRASSKSRILSISDDESDTEEEDSAGSTGPVNSYDLLKSRDASRERIDSIHAADEDGIVLPVPPRPRDTDFSPATESMPPPPEDDSEDELPTESRDEQMEDETTHL